MESFLIKVLLVPFMFSSLFATYNIVDPPPQRVKTQKYEEETMPFSNYYKQFIPQVIQQQEQIYDDVAPLENETEESDPGSPSLNLSDTPYEESDTPQVESDISQNIVKTARQFLGWKYINGGKNPSAGGFDCSGLIHYVFQQNGIEVPNYSGDFQKIGSQVNNLYDVQPGDIICTDGHVKMVSKIENGNIFTIEAKGRKWGIVETPLKSVKDIITIRRVLENNSQPTTDSQSTSNTPINGKFNTHRDFVQTLNKNYQIALRNKGLDPNYSYILVAQDANESGWGQHLAGTFNYGGIKGKTGSRKKTFEHINGRKVIIYDTFRNFNSIQDYCNYKINLLSNNRYKAFSTVSANSPSEFIRHINDSGYSTSPSNTYVPYIMGIYRTVRRLSQ